MISETLEKLIASPTQGWGFGVAMATVYSGLQWCNLGEMVNAIGRYLFHFPSIVFVQPKNLELLELLSCHLPSGRGWPGYPWNRFEKEVPTWITKFMLACFCIFSKAFTSLIKTLYIEELTFTEVFGASGCSSPTSISFSDSMDSDSSFSDSSSESPSSPSPESFPESSTVVLPGPKWWCAMGWVKNR